VHGNVFTVVGPSLVAISDGAMHQGKPYYVLRHGTRFDLCDMGRLAGLVTTVG